MRILLISVNRERMPSPVFPLGLAYLAGVLRDGGHPVEVIDLCFSKDVLSDVREAIQRFQPGLIGFSLRNLDNLTYPTSVSYLGEAEEIIRVCRRSSSARLVIGGSGYSLAPRELLQHFDVDFGIIGEGEEILIQLTRSLGWQTMQTPYAAGGTKPAISNRLICSSRFWPSRHIARIA